MAYPKIIESCLPLLRVLTNYNVQDIALVNVLNAKLTYMVSLKNITFKQFETSIAKPLAYYAINFMSSGASKDFTVDCINNYLLDFLEPYLESKLDTYKKWYYEDQYNSRVIPANPKNKSKIEEEIEQEIKAFRVINTEIEEANLNGVYEEARQIEKIGTGALFIRIPELGDYIDSATKSDKDKRNLMKKLKNIYEGTITPSIISGDKCRKPVKNIPVQAIMYTDFENLISGENNAFFKEMLKTGYARRCFIYMPESEDVNINYPVDHETVSEYLKFSIDIREELIGIFNKLTSSVLSFSKEAQDLIYRYKCECIDEVNKLKHKKSIVATDLSESFWKIQKLSVLYQVLDNPLSTEIDSVHLQMAIDFYKEIQPSLTYVMERRTQTPIEKLAEYIHEHKEDMIYTMDLRKTKILGCTNNFKKNFEDMFEDLNQELEIHYGYTLINAKGERNRKGFKLVKLKNEEKDVLTEL